MADKTPPTIQPYASLLASIKERIESAQVRAATAVNQELVLLYWGIGKEILDRQKAEGWGSKVIDQLAGDLRRSFPQMNGLSPRNLKYMRALAEAWPEQAIVQAPLAQLTWFHNLTLLEKVKDKEERLWYARAAIEYGWSRNILVMQIESDLYRARVRRRPTFRPRFQSRNPTLPSRCSKTRTTSISSRSPRMLTNENWRPAL